jgi:hypothetical protein
MSFTDLSLDRWLACTDSEARRTAEMIGREHHCVLVSTVDHEYGGRRGRVALFERDGMRFALVPAARVRLGCDGGAFRPSSAQAASYAQSANEHGLPGLADFVDATTSPVRRVELPALLVSTFAATIGVQEVGADHPEVADVVERTTRIWRTLGRAPATVDGVRTLQTPRVRISVDASGAVLRAVLTRPVGHREAVELLAARGLRPATPNEWEYACGAGAATLFRWGDDCPDHGNPVEDRTGPHRRSNFFGLAIGQDPYQAERSSDPAVVCGGDGGTAVHHERGVFLGWLTLATAYRDAEYAALLQANEGELGPAMMRAVIDL